MTENEIIDFLEDEINGLEEQKNGDMGEIAAEVFKEIIGDERIKVFRTAITVLKEIQRYREIGTVEQVRNQKHNLEVSYKIISDYESIGTVEECREAVEKQKAQKPEFINMLSDTKYAARCTCGRRFMADIDCRYNPRFCSKCGARFDWSEEDE